MNSHRDLAGQFALSICVGIRAAAATVLALSLAAAAPQEASRFSIFDVPLGASATDIDAMAAVRGYQGRTPAGRCLQSYVCWHRITIEGLPGTEFMTTMWGERRLPERRESFSFAFAAPPNAHMVWASGSDQYFGAPQQPGPDAPLLSDVMNELNQRYGPPSQVYGAGGARLPQGSPPRMLWWVWDASGRPVRWTDDMRETCYRAMSQSAVIHGGAAIADRNAAATDAGPLILARQGNCAKVVRVEIDHIRGLVQSLSVRMADFQAGHDAFVHTLRLVEAQRAVTNRNRSERNRPTF